MLKTRVITAIVLLAILLPVTLWAPIGGFGALIAFVVVFAAWEWARLLKLPAAGPVIYAIVAALALVASTKLGTGVTAPRPLFEASSIFWIFAGPFVLSLLLVVWLADIGAYFAGKAFGKHKLAPSISPGKTWEGAIGGWLAVMIVAAVAVATHAFAPTLFSALLDHLGTARAFATLTLLVVFSVVGDLFESMLKRQAGVKDSSNLLPGHGGVLDRIDALLPVLPLAMLVLS